MATVCETVSAHDLHQLLAPLLDKQERTKNADPVAVGWTETPLGTLLLAATDNGLCMAEFFAPERLAEQIDTLRKCFGRVVIEDHPHLIQARDELSQYFAGGRTEFDVPLAFAGTPFQQSVWKRLRQIPYGTTLSYEGLAKAVGIPKGSRAVGRANGQNRLTVFIPCHRVINKDGALGGYGGSVWRKKFLLQLEGSFEE
jgi:AraC family transcriptional regulator, regulatory protein of adaptative response / methylated-DNA-[protein]-cysteine methyltransferase